MKYLSILTLCIAAPLSIVSFASGLGVHENQQYEAECGTGAKLHERRIFDALSDSKFIDWTKVELVEINSRFDYTDSVNSTLQDQQVACDLMIDYRYNDKVISLNSTYRVSLEENETISQTDVTAQAVQDFIVRVIVN
ncbi:hypothetical protein L4C33_04110 [Vibrio makurazakiensis]|uniref:hypothetical protein n=1 Tax=Vibrio makurazakiensis TaxID=2910250 RepID=UPI003D1258A9